MILIDDEACSFRLRCQVCKQTDCPPLPPPSILDFSRLLSGSLPLSFHGSTLVERARWACSACWSQDDVTTRLSAIVARSRGCLTANSCKASHTPGHSGRSAVSEHNKFDHMCLSERSSRQAQSSCNGCRLGRPHCSRLSKVTCRPVAL